MLSDFDSLAAVFQPPVVGVAQGIRAAAIFLHVELLTLAYFEHTRRASFLAPVECAIRDARILASRTHAAVADLLKIFPTRDAQRTGDYRKTVVVGVQGSTFESHVETHRTADAALRLVFHAFRTGKPVINVVVGIHEGYPVLFCKANVFVFAQVIFLTRMDVWVIK